MTETWPGVRVDPEASEAEEWTDVPIAYSLPPPPPTPDAERMLEEVRAQRLGELHAWQRYYGMEPRSDSQLTAKYVDGVVLMPPDMVARELISTHFLYQSTLYGELIEPFLRIVARRVKKHHRLSWTATWRIVRFYGPFALKLICLLMAGERIPQCLAEGAT